MTERLRERQETLRRLMLDDLQIGDSVAITLGSDVRARHFRFQIENVKERWPMGPLVILMPDGSEIAQIDFTLCGAGQWTTKRENPLQSHDVQFTSYYDSLYIGGIMVGDFNGDEERTVFDDPGQRISAIELRQK